MMRSKLLLLFLISCGVGFTGNESGRDCRGAMRAVVDDTTPGRYDRAEGQYFAAAEVMPNAYGYTGPPIPGQRTLDITIYLRSDKGRSKQLRGKEEYRRILKHFKGQFDQILGNWLETPFDAADNLVTFNASLRDGLTPEQAALQTWSGQRAAENGYTEVQIQSLEGSPGSYTDVKLVFRKPATSAK